MCLEARLWQHPVGQGLFHSGAITIANRRPFRYVYDCGKHHAKAAHWPPLIGPALTDYERRPLDALFISHFDTDHTNGLSELLRLFGGAKHAFLPYLHPAARVLMAAREEARGSKPDDSYFEFLDDPAQWLATRGVAEVVFVGGKPPGPEGGPAPLPDGPENPDDFDGAPAPLYFKARPRPPDGMTLAELDADRWAPRTTRTASPVKYLDHRDGMLVHAAADDHPAWVFQTYVDPDDHSERAIRRQVETALGASRTPACQRA